MRVDEKLARFQNRDVLPTLSVSRATLPDLAVKFDRFLGPCVFEESVVINSPVLSPSRQAFIGANSYMNDGGYIRDRVFIGRFCSIGRRVTIGAGAHSMTRLSTSPAIRDGSASPYTNEQMIALGLRQNRLAETIIENDVWIGDGAIVMPGVRIASGSVVGANCVVVSDVPAYSIVGGVPARVIRYRFPVDIIEALLSSEWWELPNEILNELPTGNVVEFLELIARTDLSERRKEFDSYVLES